MDLLGRKMKKICSIFFHFFPWAQMTLIWIFLVKLRMDIKMANPWLHRNHQYRSKYYVLLSFLAYWKSPFRVRTPCIDSCWGPFIPLCPMNSKFPIFQSNYTQVSRNSFKWIFKEKLIFFKRNSNSLGEEICWHVNCYTLENSKLCNSLTLNSTQLWTDGQ